MILSLFALFCSCGINYEAHVEKKFPDYGWTYNDSLSLDMNIVDTSMVYRLNLEIEHTPGFKNQNFYVFLRTKFPDGKQVGLPLSIEMADETGKWYGSCLGESCNLPIDLQDQVFFEQPGRYSITLRQYSRNDTLEGIKRVQLSLENLRLSKKDVLSPSKK